MTEYLECAPGPPVSSRVFDVLVIWFRGLGDAGVSSGYAPLVSSWKERLRRSRKAMRALENVEMLSA